MLPQMTMMSVGCHAFLRSKTPSRRRIENHIRYEFGATRKDGPPNFGLGDLRGSWEGIRTTYGDPVILEAMPLDWKSALFLEAHDETSPLPHAICTISADVDATLADQNLTLHEMRAIMRMILIRARGPRRKNPIYPFLLLSFMASPSDSRGADNDSRANIPISSGQIRFHLRASSALFIDYFQDYYREEQGRFLGSQQEAGIRGYGVADVDKVAVVLPTYSGNDVRWVSVVRASHRNAQF
ncbi:uncharacterized protein N7443_003241 [Penicillium atrosanguineum]|uniref:Uncharacterized protein n=1 Tax=Penicillium atrosanguineum TaxID=1132637 RepID=A0A9W9PXM4_9EURO|nr:uncharacterized protein N7443_003241 [Penicillium atrosanguineum]KAJ5310780.1 hypothetical protein N7443_003241 [Penicillium atrosanguineum]KAJ5316304.1 hypothetical protein N7476_006611 [Penicillium atrosanguineum]